MRAAATRVAVDFFTEYPRFFQTGRSDLRGRRMQHRHTALIEANRDAIAGKRVLDLASHDGRWSFAALAAGAHHVTGVEARRNLVESAHQTFGAYGVHRDRYRFAPI